MRILITTQAVDLGDPILGFFHRWIEEFAKHCESVHVICLRQGETNLPPNVFVHSLGKENGASRLARVIRFYRYVFGFRHEYDAVFAHMNPEYVVLAGPLWRMWGKRVALWYVHKSVTWWLRVAHMYVQRIFTAVPNSITLTSNKIRVMGHGMDIDAYTFSERSDDDTVSIFTVGRLSRSKGVHTMVDICGELENRGVKTELSVYGGPVTADDRVYETELQKLISTKSYKDALHLHGNIRSTDVPRVLTGADIFLNISTTGGLDKASLEAMLSGVPIISSNPTFKDLLDQYGLYISNPNSVSVADAIQEYFKKPATERNAMLQSLRDIVVERHSLDQLVPNLVRDLSS